MGYTMDAVRRARQRLEAMNEDLRSRYNARQEEAYRRVPRIREIDGQLRRSMVTAAKAVLAGSDGPAMMDKVRQENLALQRERAALVAENFPAGYLEDGICPKCGGSGYLGAQMCSCLEALCRQEQEKEVSRLGEPHQRFEGFRLDLYSEVPDPRTGFIPRMVAQRALTICQEYAANFSQGSGNLLLTGMPGLGKTYLAVCVGKAVAAQGKTVCYETAISLFDKLERGKFNPTPENQAKAEELSNCDLLILDDLGTEFAGAFVNAALYGLLNGRMLEGKPMVVTTNLNWAEMEQRYSPQIASRLSGEFTLVRLVGDDIRRKKAAGAQL